MSKILQYPHPRLSTACPSTSYLEPGLDKEIESLKQVLESTPNGLALAANQVGYQNKLFVVRADAAIQFKIPEVVLNPTWWNVEDHSFEEMQEGCLSFTDLLLNIQRYKFIDVSFDAMDGSHATGSLTGIAARMWQHECEHLDGQTFLENVPRIQRFQIMAEMRKRKGG